MLGYLAQRLVHQLRLIAQVLDGQLILAQFVAVSSDAPAVGNCDV
jgi:hypothetical protein